MLEPVESEALARPHDCGRRRVGALGEFGDRELRDLFRVGDTKLGYPPLARNEGRQKRLEECPGSADGRFCTLLAHPQDIADEDEAKGNGPR
jgi:hypothetical protein